MSRFIFLSSLHRLVSLREQCCSVHPINKQSRAEKWECDALQNPSSSTKGLLIMLSSSLFYLLWWRILPDNREAGPRW